MRESRSNVREMIIPLLFSMNCTSWILNLVTEKSLLLCIVEISIIHIPIFAFLNFVKQRNRQGIVHYIAMTIVLIIGMLFLSVVGDGDTSYSAWLSVAPHGEKCTANFYIISSVLFSYFFASVTFYFTLVIKRTIIILLIGFIPLFFHVGRCEKGINFSFVMFILLFMLLYIISNLNKDIFNKEVNVKIIIVILIIIIGFTSIIPVPKFNNKIADTINTAYGDSSSKKLNTSEAKKDANIDIKSVPQSNKILFEVDSDEPLYIRVQSWDKYLDNKWCVGDTSLLQQEPVEDTDKLIPSIDDVAVAVEDYYGDDNDEINILKQYKSVDRDIKKARIYYRNYKGEYLLNVPGTFNIRIPGKKEKIYKDGLAKYYLINQDIDENMIYEIEYMSQNMKKGSLQKELLSYLNKERYYDIFHSMEGKNFFIEQGLYDGIKDSIKYRYKYIELPDTIPDRIYDLADKITKDKDSDYEKAVAIEKFFKSGEFKYDFDMGKAANGQDYNDFFIFEGKKGVCVQFASAMVILARASGLPARYVEGFVADEFDENSNRYIVREKDAHAFPEVYISGYGWMTFEPTVGISDESNNGITYKIEEIADKISELISKLYVNLSMINIILIFVSFSILLIISIYIYINLREIFWRHKVLKYNNDVIIKEIFKRVVLQLEKLDVYFDNDDTYITYGNKVFKDRGIIISDIIEILNKNQYRGVVPSDEEIDKSFEDYYKLRSIIKNRVGKIKGLIM
ncbi:Hypothetical protein CM240_2346 [Clostridium bornimense]|uniref:Transglutaminase-like domain-containing protein n=1 Tax=Clostridium bornimense TaxID=1216932 RepID=W6RYG2_9CLOT|nr:transglutaminase-like domain-containing protein [Clostridium bornimense]CDM69483.1 Hypothetical protein CM240_2346 [Clostridium bornimense]